MIVYKYGLRPPISGAETVRAQMRAERVYRNVLVEIERGRRAAIRACLNHAELLLVEARMKDANAAHREARDALKKKRAATRSVSETKEQREAEEIARKQKKSAWEELKRVRSESHEKSQPEKDRINELASELRRNARKHCGLHWGTYQLAEDAAERSFKIPLFDELEPNDPRWVGRRNAHVSVQVMMQSAEEGKVSRRPPLFGCQLSKGDAQVQVIDAPLESLSASKAGAARQAKYKVLRMRVSHKSVKPVVWAEWPMLMHRPIPPSGIVKRVTVTLSENGPYKIWSAEFTVDDGGAKKGDLGTGKVAIEFGWRKLANGGMMLASTMDLNGERTPFFLTKEDVEAFRFADSIRSERDYLFNEMKKALGESLEAVAAPKWATEQARFSSQWKKKGRLVSFVRAWSRSRWTGDERAFSWFDAWRARDHHLWQYECGQRRGALMRRREKFRLYAVGLARRYGEVSWQDADLSEVVKKDEIDLGNKNSMSNHQIAAAGLLCQIVKEAFASRGGIVSKAESVNSNTECPKCEVVEAASVDVGAHSFACVRCGHLADLDAVALMNVLRRGGDGEFVKRVIENQDEVIRKLQTADAAE